jgi:hypothetical protein
VVSGLPFARPALQFLVSPSAEKNFQLLNIQKKAGMTAPLLLPLLTA